MVTTTRVPRAHVIAGGYPPGSPAGHDHDFARLQILGILEDLEAHASVGNDFKDLETWLPLSRLMITYVAGPYLNDDQNAVVRRWIEGGGRWIGLHGSSGGKAARTGEGRRRRMVKTSHHETLGGFFINHPPVRKFEVTVVDGDHPITRGVPERFEVVDEPYMIEVEDPAHTRVLLTSAWGPDPSPNNFGFLYDQDTSLYPDGKTRAVGFVHEIGAGAAVYIALGHCHTPSTNSQPYVDSTVDPEGKTPLLLRGSWETDGFRTLLRNAIAWGLGLA
jgi:type 1 glutamine amidotransferase